ncbi:MAG: 16S rRNA (cytosine(1402)-N(4))-methyltransferase RsmH [Candidatus Omnitrophica bacterium]|nr:16S rRNA (cytosine(1402)-N(4))-methyltransferase RsmH [Candidatus Omnitrophota bacterium]
MDEQNQNNQEPHKRRVRYRGKNPRRFEEKYKEHNPEKYADDVKKIMESGHTPAGMHRPICVQEILEFFNLKPGQIGLDATLGYGGHAQEFLKRITPGGCLYAIDVDPIEILRTQARLRGMGFTEKDFITRQINFAGISKLLTDVKDGFDFILADLGVSSMQLDNSARGFTFKTAGPLDLRFNPEKDKPASERIKSLSLLDLEKILWANADEPFTREIAQAIHRRKEDMNTTSDLTFTVRKALSKIDRDMPDKDVTRSIRRTFQALRIMVNEEFSVLEQFLRNVPFCLKPGGKVAILTFHSGEYDRVTESFKQGLETGLYSEINQESVRASFKEQYDNPRSKSAVLRWAVKK